MKVTLHAPLDWQHMHACAAVNISMHSTLHCARYNCPESWVSSQHRLKFAHLCFTCGRRDRRPSYGDRNKGGRHEEVAVHFDVPRVNGC